MANTRRANAMLFILASVLMTSAAQLLFKLGMLDTAVPDASLSFADAALALLATANLPALAIGVTLYAISMLVWILALTQFPVSVAYPILSISYVVVYLAATLIPVFSEMGSFQKLIGVGFVVVGVSALSLNEFIGRADSDVVND